MRRLRSRRNRNTKPNSDSAPTGIPTPAPTVTLFWDEGAGLDDGSTGAGVGVSVDVVVIAGSEKIERIDDVGVDTELGEVAIFEDEVASVDDIRSVALAHVSGCMIKGPSSSEKRKLLQQPAPASAVASLAPQHQLLAV